MTFRIEVLDPEARLRVFARTLRESNALVAITTAPHVCPQDKQPRSTKPQALVTYRGDAGDDRFGYGSDHMTVGERFALDIWIDEEATTALLADTKDPTRHAARIRKEIDAALRADNLNATMAAFIDAGEEDFRFVEAIARLVSPWFQVPNPTTENTRHHTADYEVTFYDVS